METGGVGLAWGEDVCVCAGGGSSNETAAFNEAAHLRLFLSANVVKKA